MSTGNKKKAQASAASRQVNAKHILALPYDEQFLVFYGLHQLYVPKEMGFVLNPAEYLGLHLAAQLAKQEKRGFYLKSQSARLEEMAYEQQPEKLAAIRAEAFHAAVNGLVKVSYASSGGKPVYPGILKLHHMKGNPHPTRPGDLQSRLDSVTAQPSVVESFLESFRWPLILSFAESEKLGQFYDPGLGKPKEPSPYIHEILGIIHQRCQ